MPAKAGIPISREAVVKALDMPAKAGMSISCEAAVEVFVMPAVAGMTKTKVGCWSIVPPHPNLQLNSFPIFTVTIIKTITNPISLY
ncbi:hypothetical protein BH10BAC5_BH10BAC5_19610 [soil metagenome]